MPQTMTLLSPKGSLCVGDISTPRYGAYSKAYPHQAHWHKHNRLPTSYLLLLATLMLAAAAGGRALLARQAHGKVLYVLVIDSGSSGTRIYAYNWTQDHGSSSSGRFPTVHAIPPSAAAHLVPKHANKGMYNRVETRPGLDAFAANATGLAGALEPLLAWARAVVPARHHVRTPLMLMGTGGLRRLPADQQELLLAEVRRHLGQSGFRFEPEWARVITGDDEGAFGWLALNYQQGRLRPHRTTSTTAAAAGAASRSSSSGGGSSSPATITSLGALDMGGSSLQITFEVPPLPPSSSSTASTASSSSSTAQPPVSLPPEYNISVAGHTFNLHLHSFKQYGLNEAYDRAITALYHQQHPQQLGSVPADAATPVGGSSKVGASNATDETPVPATGVPDTTQAAAAAAAAVQHDLAVARAAGVQAADATSAADIGNSALPADELQQDVQADLAAAAAAGFHPQDTALPNATSSGSISSSSSSIAVKSEDPSASGASSSSSSSRSSSSSSYRSSVLDPVGTSSHTGLRPHPSSSGLDVLQGDSSSGGLTIPGRHLRQRRSLLQQQLLWLEQLLSSAQDTAMPVGNSRHSSSSSSGSRVLLQHGRDVRFRQLLRHMLLRDDPVLATATASNSTSGVGSPTAGAPMHFNGSSSSSSTSLPSVSAVAVQEQHPQDGTAGAQAATGVVAAVSSNSSTLPVVLHPCLHKGYEAVYTRVAYEGVAPQPTQVLLRGQPDWEGCLRVVDDVVNASAPCSVEEHRPSCVLATPQPELQGSFMALTGFYVVSHFLGVTHESGQSLAPLLDAAQTLCGRSWSWVQQHLGSNVNVERYCTWGPYVVKLLLHGLGLEEQQVLIAQDGGLGWPLGAVLAEASKLPGFSPRPAAAGAGAGAAGAGAAGASTAGVVKQEQQQQDGKAVRSSMRGAGGILKQDTPAADVMQAQPAQSQPAASQQLRHQPHRRPLPAAQGPSWSLGLLHHNQAGTGLHLSGAGWLVVLGMAWCVTVAWCRGVCGPKAAGPAALLPLTGHHLGPPPSTAPGRPHASSSSWAPRTKISPNRSKLGGW